ncbi:hypothetical protein K402DRAFT_395909, partial [Aulographum hederae CBS 113979]
MPIRLSFLGFVAVAILILIPILEGMLRVAGPILETIVVLLPEVLFFELGDCIEVFVWIRTYIRSRDC